jgi:8-oxo-dGTP diphosphatase
MAEQEALTMSQPRVAAGALFFDTDGRVLLVKPNYKDGWDIPGGYVEPGETPLAGCLREIREELGFEPDIHRLLVTDWAPSPSEGDKLLFVFDGGTLSPAHIKELKLADDELDAWAFKHRSELADAMPPRLQRRINQAVSARRGGSHRYLEHGDQPAGMRPDSIRMGIAL